MSFYLISLAIQFQVFWEFVCPAAIAAGGAAVDAGTGGVVSDSIAVVVATGTAGCLTVRRSSCKREVSIVGNMGYRTRLDPDWNYFVTWSRIDFSRIGQY